MPFECFSDPAYFDMWAVRDIENRSFNEAVHVVDKKEAEYLVERLNTLEAFLHANNSAMDATCDTIECPDCGAEFSVDCECPICKGHWLRHKQHQ